VWAGLIVGCATLVNLYAVQPYLPLRNVTMVYLLGVIITSLRLGRGPSALATVLSVVLFDLVFVRPQGSFEFLAPSDAITLGVMLSIGIIISTLTGRVRFQVQAARQREQRMSALFAMSREFATLRSEGEIAAAAEGHIGAAVDADVSVWLPATSVRPGGRRDGASLEFAADDGSIVDWVHHHHVPAGAGTANHSSARATYFPLMAAHGCMGVVRLRMPNPDDCRSPERWDLLQTLASLTALAIERASSVAAAERARLEADAERLRNSLLSAVSHDLRTPLAVIVGSSSTLVELGERLDRRCQRELAESILDEGNRLNRQVANLLEMTRLEDGSLHLQKEWQTLEEVAGVVLERLDRPLHGFNFRINLLPDLPPIPMDGQLVQQVLINLLENAVKYTPAGTAIELAAWQDGDGVIIEVADSGNGMAPDVLERAFDRFYRGPAAAKTSGVGLGLSICKGIVQLHGGRIWAENRTSGGLAVRFSLPIPPADRQIATESTAGASGNFRNGN
jgi:two-component system sensor histidine kinase KdpD